MDSNDLFIDFNSKERTELLSYLKNYYLTFRDTLGLPDYVTFGVEIEYERASRYLITKYIDKNFTGWLSTTDSSLFWGGEIDSPILYDEAYVWKELKKVCHYLKLNHVNTSHNAGGHIHIGSQIIGDNPQDWRVFLKTYAAYEDIFFRFVYGDKSRGRDHLFKYAYPIAKIINNPVILDFLSHAYMSEIYDWLKSTHRLAINFNNMMYPTDMKIFAYRDTIEFRSPNATSDEVIWQNNINAITKMLLAPAKGLIDEDLVDFRLKNAEYDYNTINLQKAFEFCDLVFDNNKDKLYFLRQYLKDFKNNEQYKRLIRTVKFTDN